VCGVDAQDEDAALAVVGDGGDVIGQLGKSQFAGAARGRDQGE
jgi:hypothetical protein